MRRWLIALGLLLLVTGAGIYKASRSTPWPEPIQGLVIEDKRGFGYTITTDGSTPPKPYVAREAVLQRVLAEELRKRLLNAFKPEDGWDWGFGKEELIKRSDWEFFAHGKRGNDTVQVEVLKGERPTVLWYRDASPVEVFIARIRNPGRDPFDEFGH